jgi:hypothetical protein
MHGSYTKAAARTKQLLAEKAQVDGEVEELRTKAKAHSKCVVRIYDVPSNADCSGCKA